MLKWAIAEGLGRARRPVPLGWSPVPRPGPVCGPSLVRCLSAIFLFFVLREELPYGDGKTGQAVEGQVKSW